MVAREDSRPVQAEQRLKELGIKLPAPPEPFGVYVEAVQTGNLLFLTGMLPTEGRQARFMGRVGAELDVETGQRAARLAAFNSIWDRLTGWLGSSGLAFRWPHREMCAISQKSPMAPRSCCRTSSERTRTLLDWW